MSGGWTLDLLGWGLTYLVHSSLCVSLVLVALRVTSPSLAAQEAAWKTALLGGLVSVALQLGLGYEPLLGRLELARPQDALSMSALPVERTERLVSDLGAFAHSGAVSLPESSERTSTEITTIRPPILLSHRERGGAIGAMRIDLAAIAVWGAASLWLLARLLRSEHELRARLLGRRAVTDERLLRRLAELAGRAGLRRQVRLSASPRLEIPLVRGILRPEICLPERALAELCERQQAAVLAHELAHVTRRDLHWQLGARLLEALVPFQPLHGLARRRLGEIAELRCDDWAVRTSGGPLPLARSLATVAGWRLAPATTASLTSATLAAHRGDLGWRVRRLLEPGGPGAMRDHGQPLVSRQRRLGMLLGAGALALTAWTAPSLSLGHRAAPPPAPAPPAPSVAAPATPPAAPAALAPSTPPPAVAPAPAAGWRGAPPPEIPSTPDAVLAPEAPPAPASPPAIVSPPTPAAAAPPVATPGSAPRAITMRPAPSWPRPPAPALAPDAPRVPTPSPPARLAIAPGVAGLAVPPGAAAAWLLNPGRPPVRPTAQNAALLWTPPPAAPAAPEGEHPAELLALERSVALLQEQAALLATETPPPSPSAPPPSPSAPSPRPSTTPPPPSDELLRALEEAVESLRSASGGSPDEARERARVLAELARDLERARADTRLHTRRAAIERQAHVEGALRARDRALADLDRDERARRERELADRERQRTVERHQIERSRAVDDEEALERKIEALELRQAELQRTIEELRRSRGRLLE